jgi:ribosome-associated protein
LTDVQPNLEPAELALLVAELAAEKKAVDIVAIDLRGLAGYTDFFLVCSGTSDRQVKAIQEAVHSGLKQGHRLLPNRIEGAAEARWILMDYLDVVVHIFVPEVRDFYRLEQLWGEAPRLELPEPEVKPEVASAY